MYTISINGKVTGQDRGLISVLDRGFLYGDSVYEVSVAWGANILFLEEHLNRLEHSGLGLGMDLRGQREVLAREMIQTLRAHGGGGSGAFYVRPIVTRGVGEITLNPEASVRYNRVVIVKNLPEYPRAWYEEGVGVIVAHTRRNPKGAMDPNIKSGNYLNNILAMGEAQRAQAFDAVMLNGEGLVTEGTTSNVWIVRDGTLITPSLDVGILGGITRGALLGICRREEGLEAREQAFGPLELREAQECFLSSSTRELVPVVSVDGSPLGDGRPGPLTRKLHGLYRDYIRSRWG